MTTNSVSRASPGVGRSKPPDSVAISVASPDTILGWSKGEVTNDDTISYKTRKPLEGGLFCQRIFGPVKDWECSCGDYKGKEHRGVVCGQCGVEVTRARVRRRRMGHIALAAPVAHIWFIKNAPSPIGLALDLLPKDLDLVIYHEGYMVVDPKNTTLNIHEVLSETEYREAQRFHGSDSFTAKTGAEAVRDALCGLNLPEKVMELQQAMRETKKQQVRKRLVKRINLLRAFRDNSVRPEWMILTVLPVIPPELRPWILLKDDRVATTDLNDLYSRVILQNNRLKGLLQSETSEEIIQDEKRKLQEAVDALLDNGRNGHVLANYDNEPFKSLSDRLKGKTGRFRRNLLGKRVDYSGRSVIVIGPELKLHQCGLPKKMALILFEPFIIRRLRELGYVHTNINVRRIRRFGGQRALSVFEQVTTGHEWSSETSTLEGVVMSILHEIVKDRPILLNRAPTLHRLSIQAFEPVLIDGDMIRLHPLVCAAYNADFDGDQMAVHVPLSVEAQLEARMLMMAPNNIFSPASGKPVVTPTQDIPLGCYYLTAEPRTPPTANPRSLKLFGTKIEAIFAYSVGAITTHERIRLANPDLGKETEFGAAAEKVIITTVGRVLFSEVWPPELGFCNKSVNKSDLGDMIWRCYEACGHEKTVIMLDQLKELGFRKATRAGVSIGIDDLIIPKVKDHEIDAAKAKVREVKLLHEKERHQQGLLNRPEYLIAYLKDPHHRDNIMMCPECRDKIVRIWGHCTTQVSNSMMGPLEANQGKGEYNPVSLMLNSGARGNKEQVRQLIGLRGLMVNADGKIVEWPIHSNFREGLNILEYFISGYGVRKGVGDKTRQTAAAGYLTRKLVSVAQDVIIGEEDCGTHNGNWVQAIYDEKGETMSLAERLIGRVVCEDISDPVDADKVIVSANQVINEDLAKTIDQAGIKKVKVRSVLTCESEHGVCVYCYGHNLATGNLVKLGEAVGIIAAQSIGEPGTQLTMRTFHTGGTASQTDITGGLQRVSDLFEARRRKNASKRSQIKGVVTSIADVLGERRIIIMDLSSGIEKGHYAPMSEDVLVKQGDHVRKGQPLTSPATELHKVFQGKGLQEFQQYFVQAVQEIYRPQGVTLSDKHIEVILRQMLRKVRITEPGDTAFSRDEEVDKLDFEEENQHVEGLGRKPSKAEPILLGITQASRHAKSFLSAASFQYTTQILAEAAAMSKRDELRGLSESIITGRLIPAGTGFDLYRNARLKPLAKTENEAGPVVPPDPKP